MSKYFIIFDLLDDLQMPFAFEKTSPSQVGKSKERDINPAFTNVSHTVHHLTFGDAPRSLKASLPRQYSQHVDPLARQTFSVDKFHKARLKIKVHPFQMAGLPI